MKSPLKNIKLTSYDELLNPEIAQENGEKIQQIPLSELHTPQIHPFKVTNDEKMQEMAESIKKYGVMTPAIVRPLETGGYELVSGNRRKYAAEMAGLATLPAIVRDLDDDAAIILMVDANLQREEILPSERAFAYKLKLEAMKRQTGRPSKENYSPMGNNFKMATSSQELAEQVGESKNQIFRYIRLTELTPELLEMVDEKLMSFRPAVEVSYLTKEEQEWLAESINLNECTPSLAQALRLKQFSQDGQLNAEKIEEIMSEEKPIERKLVLDGKWITKRFSKEMTPKEIRERIERALDMLERNERRKMER